MSELHERHLVACPYNLARQYLAASLRDRAQSGDPGALTLHASLAGTDVKKNVIATFSPATDPMHLEQPWHVHWTPEGGGPYPDFDGELTVRADEDYKTAILELAGEYRPPGGALGAVFDRAVGSRIASETAQMLLAHIGAAMEARYRSDEQTKHAGVSHADSSGPDA